MSDSLKQKLRPQLEKNIAAFGKLARFSPFIAGERFTLADCAAAMHLPVLGGACKIIYGEDLLAALPVKDYLKRVGERPAVQKVNADRKAGTEVMLARYQSKA